MTLVAVIDACVIYDFGARDTLLRAAVHGLFRPVWTRRILEEARRNLEQNRPDKDFARLFTGLLEFEEWLAEEAQQLEAALTIDPPRPPRLGGRAR